METLDKILKLYRDEKSQILSNIYDLDTCPDKPIRGSLGDLRCEEGAYRFLTLAKRANEIVGIDCHDIEMGKYHPFFYSVLCLESKYIRTEDKNGARIIFPTEELLINQGVKKK